MGFQGWFESLSAHEVKTFDFSKVFCFWPWPKILFFLQTAFEN